MHLLTRKNLMMLIVAGAVLFAIGAIGQDDGYWTDGPGWLGAIGWFGFLTCLLLLVVGAAVMLVQQWRHRRGHGLTH